MISRTLASGRAGIVSPGTPEQAPCALPSLPSPLLPGPLLTSQNPPAGAEPGADPSKPDGGHASMPTLSAPCEISVVDFSHDKLSLQKLDNDTLAAFLSRPKPDWVKCRWINVNGLSWDVIKALGRHKNLHKLALEDIMNTRNRTKAEWYAKSHRYAGQRCPILLTDAGFLRMPSSF